MSLAESSFILSVCLTRPAALCEALFQPVEDTADGGQAPRGEIGNFVERVALETELDHLPFVGLYSA